MDLGTDEEEVADRKVEKDPIRNIQIKHNRREIEENNNAKDIHKKDNVDRTLTVETETKKDSSSISQLHVRSGETTSSVLPIINVNKFQSSENELQKSFPQTSTNITIAEELSHPIQPSAISKKDPRLHKTDHTKDIRSGQEKGILCHSLSKTKTLLPDIQTTEKVGVDPRTNHQAYKILNNLPIELKIPDFLEDLKKHRMRSNNLRCCRQLNKGTTKIIRNRSLVCIDNIKSIKRSSKKPIADLRQFCCHVSIRRNECKYFPPQKSPDINVSLIDTKKSYLIGKDVGKEDSQVKEQVQTSRGDTKKCSNIEGQFQKTNKQVTVSPVNKDLKSLIDTKKSYLSRKESDKINTLVKERKSANANNTKDTVVNRRSHPSGKETEEPAMKQQNRPSIKNQPRSCKRKDQFEEKKQKDIYSLLTNDEPQQAKMRRKFICIDQKERPSTLHRNDASIRERQSPVQGKREILKQKNPMQQEEDPLKSSRKGTVVRSFLGKHNNYYNGKETPTNSNKTLKLDTNFSQDQSTYRHAKDATESSKKSDIGKGTALKRNIVNLSTTVKKRKIEIPPEKTCPNEIVLAGSSIVSKSSLSNSLSSIVPEMCATSNIPENSHDTKYSHAKHMSTSVCSKSQVCTAADVKEIPNTSFSNSKDNKKASTENINLINKAYSLNCSDVPESKSKYDSEIAQSSISISVMKSSVTTYHLISSTIVPKMCAASNIPEKSHDRKYSQMKPISTNACSVPQLSSAADDIEIPKRSFSNSKDNNKASTENLNFTNHTEYSLHCPELLESQPKSDSGIPQHQCTKPIDPMTSSPCIEDNIKAACTKTNSVEDMEYLLHITESSESKCTSGSAMSSEELLKGLDESIESMTHPDTALQNQLPENRDPQTTNQAASQSSIEYSCVQVDNSSAKSAPSDDKVDENTLQSSEKPHGKNEERELNSGIDQVSKNMRTSSGNVERAINTSVEDNEANYNIIVGEEEQFFEDNEGDELLLLVKVIKNPEVKAELEEDSMMNLGLDLFSNQPEIKTENSEYSSECTASIPTVPNQASSKNDKSVARECTPEEKTSENKIINAVRPSMDSLINFEEILKEKSSDSIPRDPVSSKKEFQTTTSRENTIENKMIDTVLPSTDSRITLGETLKEKSSDSVPRDPLSSRTDCQTTIIESSRSKGTIPFSRQLNRNTITEVSHISESPQCMYSKADQKNSKQDAREFSQENCSRSSQSQRKPAEVERSNCSSTLTSEISTAGTKSDIPESTMNNVSKSVTTQSTNSCSNTIISTTFCNTDTNIPALINETRATGCTKNAIRGAEPHNSSSDASSIQRESRMPKMSNIVSGSILDQGTGTTRVQSEISTDFGFNALKILNAYIIAKCRGDDLVKTLEYLTNISNTECGAKNVIDSMSKMKDVFAYILLRNLRSLSQNKMNPIIFVSNFLQVLVRTMKNEKVRPFMSHYICELLTVHSKEYEKNSTLKYFKTYIENDTKALRHISGIPMTVEQYMTLKSQIFHYLHSLTIPISNDFGENYEDRSTNRQNGNQYVTSQSTCNKGYSLQNGNNNTSPSAPSYILNNSSEQEKQQKIVEDITIQTILGNEQLTSVTGNLKRSGNTPVTTSKPPRKKSHNMRKEHSSSSVLKAPSVNPTDMCPNYCRPEQNGSSVHLMNLTCVSTCHLETPSRIPPNTFPCQVIGGELNRNAMASGRGGPITSSRITPNSFSKQIFAKELNRNSIPSGNGDSITSSRITPNSFTNQISGAEFNRNAMASGPGVLLSSTILSCGGDLNRGSIPSGSSTSSSSTRITPNCFSNQISPAGLNSNAMASGTRVPISSSSITPYCVSKQTFGRDLYRNNIPSEISAPRITQNSFSNQIYSAEWNRMAMASGSGVQMSSCCIASNSFTKQTLGSDSNRNSLPSVAHASIPSSGISPNSFRYQMYGGELSVMPSGTGPPTTSLRITTNVFKNKVNDESNIKIVSPITGAVIKTFNIPPNTIQNQTHVLDVTRNGRDFGPCCDSETNSDVLPSGTGVPITSSRITQGSSHNQIYEVGHQKEIMPPVICTPPTSKEVPISTQNENHIQGATRNGRESPLGTDVTIASPRISPPIPQNQTNIFEATRTGKEPISAFGGILRREVSLYPTPPSSNENAASANIGEIQMTNPSNDWNSTNEDKPNVSSPSIEHSEVKPLITSPSLQKFSILSQCSLNLKDEPDETIDLTLLEDDEVKLEPSHDGYSLTLEEPMESLLILHNRKCLCGKDAIYLCACNTVMYCCQTCQFKDWENHQRVCPAGIIP